MDRRACQGTDVNENYEDKSANNTVTGSLRVYVKAGWFTDIYIVKPVLDCNRFTSLDSAVSRGRAHHAGPVN